MGKVLNNKCSYCSFKKVYVYIMYQKYLDERKGYGQVHVYNICL